MSSNADKVTFDALLKQLEELVGNMEQGDLSLEDSLKSFEQGTKLLTEARQRLDKAEQQVQVLTEKMKLEPMTDADGD